MQDVAQEDFAYEKIMAEPTVQLQILADALDVGVKVTTPAHAYACFVSASIVRCHAKRCSAICCTCVDIVTSSSDVTGFSAAVHSSLQHVWHKA